MKISKNKKGFIFLEVIISISLISIVFIALFSVGFSSLNVSQSLQLQSKADALLKEELEALRAFRDSTASTWSANGVGSFTIGSDYHMVYGGSPETWSVVSGSETVGEITRKIVFEQALRDVNGNIVSSGGTNDPDTRKITAEASFGSKTYQIVTYLTNWQK